MNENKTPRAAALLPIAVFLVLYLGLGIVLEYVLKVKMGFYQIPIVVAFLVAILVAFLQNRSISFDEKLALMGQGIGDKNIVTMILIFLAAGIFVGVTGRSSAEAVAYFLLSIAPAKLAVAVLFVVACFVSMAMGTSVGTIFPTSNFQPTRRSAGGRKYGKGTPFLCLLRNFLPLSLLHGKSDFAKAGQKKNAANCDVSNCFFYEETRELYSPVISLLASSIPFAVADRIFKSFSLMPLSMVSS